MYNKILSCWYSGGVVNGFLKQHNTAKPLNLKTPTLILFDDTLYVF